MKKILIIALLISCDLAWAQLDNRTFFNRNSLDSSRVEQLYLDFQSLGFSKNNEYFNRIADGYTLFGYHLNPSLVWYASDRLRVDLGVFAWQDFGATGFQRVNPTFSIKMKQADWQFIFGNLEGSLNHGLVEPLYNFEGVLNDRLENGLQALLIKDKVFFDAWVNWETMLYRGDSSQEEVSGGISFRYKLIEKKNFSLTFPFQFKAYHEGGQIDRSEAPLTTLWNHATGLEALWPVNPDGFLKAVTLDAYWLAFKDFSFVYQLPYQQGFGVFLNAGIKTKHFDLMASYWKGQNFISYKGGLLYPSVSSTYKYPDALRPDRQLLIFRFIQNIYFSDDLSISMRFEPHIDLESGQFEFSHGAYFSYRTDFRLLKKRP